MWLRHAKTTREAATKKFTCRGKIGDVQNDSATVLPILLVLVAVALVSVVVAAVLGKITLQGMPAPMKDEIYNPDTDGTLTAQSIGAASLPLAFKGYSVDHVDRLLDAATAAIVARDKKIAELTGTDTSAEGGDLTVESQKLIDAVETGAVASGDSVDHSGTTKAQDTTKTAETDPVETDLAGTDKTGAGKAIDAQDSDAAASD